jgi:predicted nucleic acid-binding protein
VWRELFHRARRNGHTQVGNVVWKKVRLSEISQDEGRNILHALESAPLEFFPSGSLLTPAFEIAVGLDRSVYDSLYLALAVQEVCPLITADRKFYRTVNNSPLNESILWVEDIK